MMVDSRLASRWPCSWLVLSEAQQAVSITYFAVLMWPWSGELEQRKGAARCTLAAILLACLDSKQQAKLELAAHCKLQFGLSSPNGLAFRKLGGWPLPTQALLLLHTQSAGQVGGAGEASGAGSGSAVGCARLGFAGGQQVPLQSCRLALGQGMMDWRE